MPGNARTHAPCAFLCRARCFRRWTIDRVVTRPLVDRAQNPLVPQSVNTMQTIGASLPNAAAAQSHSTQMTALRRQWLLIAAYYAAGLLLGWVLMRALDAAAWHWLLPAGGLLVIQLSVVRWALPANHPPGDPTLWRTLGAANWMTLTRGLLVGLLAGFVIAPLQAGAWAWLPALLYSSERLLDFMDGYLARLTRRESRLGSILDIEFDGLGILIAVAVAVQMGKLPAWYLLLGVARPLFVLGITFRRRRGLPVHALPPSSQRRLVAGVQTAFVSVMLWPPLAAELTHPAGALFALPLVLSFGRDWLVVSGWLDVSTPAYLRAHAGAAWLVERWLPVAARALGAAATSWIIWQVAPDFARWDGVLRYAGPLYGPNLGPALVFLAGAAALLLLLGAAGRVAALLLLCLVMLDVTAGGMSLAAVLLLASAALVLHAGAGRLALWLPEERIFRTTLGAPMHAAPAHAASAQTARAGSPA